MYAYVLVVQKRMEELEAANRKLEAVCDDLEEKSLLAQERVETLQEELQVCSRRDRVMFSIARQPGCSGARAIDVGLIGASSIFCMLDRNRKTESARWRRRWPLRWRRRSE